VEVGRMKECIHLKYSEDSTDRTIMGVERGIRGYSQVSASSAWVDNGTINKAGHHRKVAC
jgi:hypothetical protein